MYPSLLSGESMSAYPVYYSCPEHGYLAVTIESIEKLKLGEKISQCSYVDTENGIAYLEEDNDAPLYLTSDPGLDPLSIPVRMPNKNDFIKNLPTWDTYERTKIVGSKAPGGTSGGRKDDARAPEGSKSTE
jgi:hypothetical protein